jgi:lipid-A-disaccharide synthase
VGFWEVAKHLPMVLWRMSQCKAWLKNERPDLLVLVDYPGFNLRLAEKASALGIPVCYYIAPQVWAWHKERVAAMRRDIRNLLVILPFERDWFRQEGMDAVYVGHPLMETVAKVKRNVPRIRKQLGLDKSVKSLVALLPGSRKSELKRIWPVLRDAARTWAAQHPGALFLVPRPSGLEDSHYPGRRPGDPFRFVPGPAWEERAACDLAWVKSGTSTVETALLGVPQVVFYKVAPFSAFLAKRLLKLKNVGMVNLLDPKPSVPELLQDDFTCEALVRESQKLIADSGARKKQLAQYARIRRSLSHPKNSSRVAAREILKLLKRP